MRYELYENGVCIQVIDTRTVSNAASEKIQEIKECCRQSIEKTGISWMVEREISGGKSVPDDVKNLCVLYRDKSNELEALIKSLAEQAADDDDKATCDQIQQLEWPYLG